MCYQTKNFASNMMQTAQFLLPQQVTMTGAISHSTRSIAPHVAQFQHNHDTKFFIRSMAISLALIKNLIKEFFALSVKLRIPVMLTNQS
jgi:hypothetical protein